MSIGIADHAFLEITTANIVAASTTSWGAKIGSLPDCLSLMGLNDLDAGFKILFWLGQGSAAPADATPENFKFSAGEPFFANYKNIGQMFGSCDVYIKKLSGVPTAGSFRITGVKRAPAKFKG